MGTDEHDEPIRELSAVGRLLWEHGVRPGGLSVREVERRTGVSRSTIALWMRPVDPAAPIRHTNTNLDLVAEGLGIDRRRLGLASMIDNGAHEATPASDDTFMARLLDIQRQARALDESVTHVIAEYAERQQSVTR